jgi:hypothetical protein
VVSASFTLDRLILTFILGTVPATVGVRAFWKDHQYEFPALASLARDVLSIPATGAGVERLFNAARDVCHYRRGSLKPKTIKDLMMFLCTSKFEIEEEQLALVEEYLSSHEIQAAKEEREAQKSQDDLEPISDNEEDNSVSNHVRVPSVRALGKRRRSIAEPGTEEIQEPVIELDDDGEVPLPDNTTILQEESNTQRRTSGRLPKRSKRDDKEFVYG